MFYYVYQYKDPFTNLPFYIGKGKGNRCFDHLNAKIAFKRIRDKISSILSLGKSPIIEIIKNFMDEDDAYNYEEKLILYYGRKGIERNGILMNICLGSRPPLYKNINFIEKYYNETPVALTNEIINSVDEFIENFEGRKRFNFLLRTDIGNNLIRATQNFPISYTVPQRLYHIKNNLLEEPVCENCRNPVSFKCYLGENKNKEAYEYAKFCSTTCRNKSKWGRDISSKRILTESEKEKIRKFTKQMHKDGRITIFNDNNPMKTIEGKLSWKKSRKKV